MYEKVITFVLFGASTAVTTPLWSKDQACEFLTYLREYWMFPL